MKLVGRDAELAVLRGEFAEVLASGSRSVFVTGDPGMGKTRLLTELAAEARRAGLRECSGRGHERARPYGLIADVLTGLLAGEDADRASAAELLETLPSRPEPARVLHSLARLLEHLAGDQPLLVMLDDLHHIDDESAQVVRGLLRHPPARRTLLVLAYRPRQARPWLPAHVQEPGIGAPATLELGPLAPEAVATASTGMCAVHRRTALRESSGIPTHLEVMLALCAGAGCPGAPLEETPAHGAPVARMLVEVDQLTPLGRTVADAAAVLGDPFGTDVLAEVAEMDERVVLRVIDELGAADLIRPDAAPRGFRFRHPLLRHAVYWAAPIGWRTGAHARAVDAVAGRGGSALQYALHVERSGRVGDELAVEVLRAAAAAAADGRPRTALRWYRAALDLLPRPETDSSRYAELLTGLVRTSVRTGRNEECLEALRAVEKLPASRISPSDRASIAECRARLAQLDGRYGEARSATAIALADIAGDGDPAVRARLRVALSELTAWDVLVPDGPRLADGALLGVAGADLPLLRAHALALHAVSLLTQGATAAARRSANGAARIADASSDAELAGRLPLMFALGWSQSLLKQHDEAARHLGRGLELCERTGQWPEAVPLLVGLSAVSLECGDLARAGAAAAEAVEMATWLGTVEAWAMALGQSAQVTAANGGRPPALPDDLVNADDSPWCRRARIATEADTAAAAESRTGLRLLSARENEVAILVSRGRTNRQIATTLQVSHKTVETHLGRIFGKLNVSSRAEIAKLVGQAGR